MGQFVSHSLSPTASPRSQVEDLEASSHRDPTQTGIRLEDVNGREKELAAFKKSLGRITAEEYDSLDPKDRAKLRDYEILKLDQEHDRLVNGKESILSPAKRAKLRTHDDSVQPHTDEGADAYFIGDAYGPVNPVFAEEWTTENPEPYLRYVKELATTCEGTHLEYLAHWMEVTCAPPKWKQLRNRDDRRADRAKKTQVCFVDYMSDDAHASKVLDNCADLKLALEADTPTSRARKARLIIVEDLSRDVVETLGALFDVDPLFFLSHIMDYLFHNTRDRWVELPNLDVDARRMNHFALSYLRARYFEDEDAFQDAEIQNGKFNVLRRLDSDRSRQRFMKDRLDLPGASVALSRAKTSLWIKPKREDEPVTAILLVDPTVSADRSYPLWGGYRPFGNTPTMEMVSSGRIQMHAPKRQSLFQDTIHWSSRMTKDDIEHVQEEPRYIAMAMYKLVIADWMTVLKYMTTMLGKIEWEFEKPHWGEQPGDIDSLLSKLSPWRRNVGYYETMIGEAIARLFPPEVRAPLHASPGNEGFNLPMFMRPHGDTDKGIFSLYTDFQNIKRQLDEIQARIKSIENTATNSINIEESRRAVEENRRSVEQNKNLARLTFLATIFIPLNFTSSFLSISPDFPTAHETIWLFFAIGIPLTISALLIVDVAQSADRSFVKKKWKKMTHKEKAPQTTEEEPVRTTSRTSTIPWGSGMRQRMTNNWAGRN